MKKIFTILVLLYVMFISCGCTKDVYTIDIDKDNHITITDIYAGEKKTAMNFTGITDEITKSPQWQAITSDKENFANTIKSRFPNAIIPNTDSKLYNDGTYIGIIQTKGNLTPNTFTKIYLPIGFSTKENNVINIEKGFIKDKYIIHLEYNYLMAEQKGSNSTKEEIERSVQSTSKTRKIIYNNDNTVTIKEISKTENPGIKSDISDEVILPCKPDEKIVIKLPQKAKKHNATVEKGKYEYEWDLFSEDPVIDIYLEYEVSNGRLGVIIIFISIMILCSIAGFVYFKSINDASL